MSGLLGHSGRTGNMGQIGTGEILVSDVVQNSGSECVVDNVFTNEFRDYKIVVTQVSGTASAQWLIKFIHEDGTSSGTNYRHVQGGCEGHNTGQNNDQVIKNWNTGEANITVPGGSVNNDLASGGACYTFTVHGPRSTETHKSMTIQSGMMRTGGDVSHAASGYFLDTTTASVQFRGFKLYPSTGNVQRCRVATYGYRNTKHYQII